MVLLNALSAATKIEKKLIKALDSFNILYAKFLLVCIFPKHLVSPSVATHVEQFFLHSSWQRRGYSAAVLVWLSTRTFKYHEVKVGSSPTGRGMVSGTAKQKYLS